MRICVMLVAALLLSVPASAQDTFKQVWVTQADSGDVIRGRIVDLSADSFAILTPDNRRVEMKLDRVLRIEAQGDSLKNGALIGAGVMLGLTALGCAGLGGGNYCARAAALNTTFGAMIGVGIDALNGGRSTLYKRAAAVKAAPALTVGFKMRW
jgi:hypothetical protein